MLDLDVIFDPDRPPEAPAPPVTDPLPASLPPEWHLLWDERAAIMEYEGGLPREHAEVLALRDILGQMRRAGEW